MIATGTPSLRRWLAAILTLALVSAGLGRGWAMASDAPGVPPSIPGVTVHICHTDGGTHQGNAPHHDCCDACALCTPVALPGAPGLPAPAPVVCFVAHAAALGWAPVLARPRTPRLAQGPPAA